jgi:hypothetical protein
MSFFKRAEKEKEEVVTPATPATSEPITGPPDVVVKSHEYTDEQSKMVGERVGSADDRSRSCGR